MSAHLPGRAVPCQQKSDWTA